MHNLFAPVKGLFGGEVNEAAAALAAMVQEASVKKILVRGRIIFCKTSERMGTGKLGELTVPF